MAIIENDGFSSLPDELVILIISFLPFIDAFRLCLLRKEWHKRALWLHCPNFELFEADFTFPGARQYSFNVGKRVRSMELKRFGKLRFVDFLNKAVNGLTSPALSKFSFRMFYSTQYQENVDKWINVALAKYVKELSLDFSDGDPIDPQPLLLNAPQYVLPNFFYENGRSIRVLNLNSCGLGSFNFQNFIGLSSLTLTRVRLHWEEIAPLLAACPLLESLCLVECYRVIKIDMSFVLLRLKRLIIRHCVPVTLGVELCLPKLQYFEYAGRMVLLNLSKLDEIQEVVLDYRLDFFYPYEAEDIVALFSGFADARILKVCTSALKKFSKDYLLYCKPPAHILHIEHLTLKTCLGRYELPAIMCLLRSSPHLKTLSILSSLMELTEYQDFMYNRYSDRLPEGIWTKKGWRLDNLERVEMQGFTAKKIEVDLLKFILRKSRFLQKLIVKPLIRGSSSENSKALKDLKDVAVASGQAVIKWY
ncbi:putative F-box protein At3g29830 [Pistacia vera]|uniref:putative F-box protein At3g29830 n=1 Tax=Pistacia vera TaxID=55513 RepID=UPI001263181D|nr:putative F-box protein At3g29830 [Pistacia vera]XP_031278634.1 putative F-box protein At3g29830 [Pistacia vera]